MEGHKMLEKPGSKPVSLLLSHLKMSDHEKKFAKLFA